MLANGSKSGTEGSVYGFDNSIVAGGRAVAPDVGSIIVVQLNYRYTFIATGLVFLCMAIIVMGQFKKGLPEKSLSDIRLNITE